MLMLMLMLHDSNNPSPTSTKVDDDNTIEQWICHSCGFAADTCGRCHLCGECENGSSDQRDTRHSNNMRGNHPTELYLLKQCFKVIQIA